MRRATGRRWSPRARLGARRARLAAARARGSTAAQGLAALALNSATSLVAGAMLASLTGTFEQLPGLVVLVPAAIGLRGNVFSALGSRLSTAIHAGTYSASWRPGSVLGDNVAASLVLTSGLAVALAVVAKAVSVAFGIEGTVSVLDLATVSIAGGLLASVLVLAATLVVASGSLRFGWDLDNLVAPVVSTLGDVLTLPSLWLATYLVGHGPASTVIGWALVIPAVWATVGGLTSRRRRLRGIVRESWPVLFVALVLSTMAGLVIEHRLETFSAEPALLVLFPAFVSSAGALGGILSARYGTALHLGTVSASAWPGRVARRQAIGVAVLAGPVYLFNAVGAYLVARLLGDAGPGVGPLVVASLVGGAAVVAFVLAASYYGAVAAVRSRVDPDTYGIPLVTSSADLVGAIALIAVAAGIGVTAAG